MNEVPAEVCVLRIVTHTSLTVGVYYTAKYKSEPHASVVANNIVERIFVGSRYSLSTTHEFGLSIFSADISTAGQQSSFEQMLYSRELKSSQISFRKRSPN